MAERETAPASTIFRYADLGAAGHIVLGEPFRQREELGVAAGRGAYHVRGWYTGTEGITVYVDASGIVTAMRFEYGPDENFASQLTTYTETLGTPQSHQHVGHVERVAWEDERTRFELIRVTGLQPASYSLLSDLQARS